VRNREAMPKGKNKFTRLLSGTENKNVRVYMFAVLTRKSGFSDNHDA